MEPPVDNNEDPRDNLEDDEDDANDANEVRLIPEEINDVLPDMRLVEAAADADGGDDDDDDDDDDPEAAVPPPDLRGLGSNFRNISVRATFDSFESYRRTAHPEPSFFCTCWIRDLRQDIVRRLRAWIPVFSPSCDMSRIEDMFQSLTELHVTEQIEQEHYAEALLEFVDVL